MTLHKFFDEETPESLDYECYINNDSPDIEHFITESDSNISKAIVLTVFDVQGDPFHSAFDLESLDLLLENLKEARKTLATLEK